MSFGKASDFRVHDQSSFGDIAKRPADSSYITLSDDSIADDASIGDVLGTLSIIASYVGTPRWEIIGQSNFAVNATTGVVTVAHALTAGADSFKVKLRGTTPQINSPTFAITVDTGGGGGGVPEWVPADAKIYIDLVNDRAWTEADGEVAIDTLLGADANADAYTAITSYDADNLSGRGYSDFDGAVAFIGSARTKLLAGSTFVIASNTSAEISDVPTSSSTILISADANAAIDFNISDDTGRAEGSSFSGDYGQEILGISNYKNGTSVKNRVAATVTPTRADFAVNGSDPQTKVLTTAEYPVSGGSAIVAAMFLSSTHAIESITIYDALPSTTGLSALSATGVTNTAPHDLTGSLIPGDVDGGEPPGIFTAAWFVGQGDPPFLMMSSLAAEDDQGNPITFSVSADASGFLSVPLVGNPGNPNSVEASAALPVGVHNFTLRATDPGGLYVEQEFTITVTANTAPHDCVASWNIVLFNQQTTSASIHSANNQPNQVLATLIATDDEGDSLTWTTTDDFSFKYAIGSDQLRILSPLNMGINRVTIRATDPGGLYVEQEFTITVTA